MQSQILKQHVLRGQQVVILHMVDKLSDSKTVHRAKLNSASPWLPFKVKKFVKFSKKIIISALKSQIYISEILLSTYQLY